MMSMTNLSGPEQVVAVGGVAVFIAAIVVRFLRWCREGEIRPNPWGPEVDAALESPEVFPVCLRCSAPHSETAWFCPECGAAVGDFNNWNPYLYIFSLGEVLRAGAFGQIRWSWLTVLGYLLLSAGEYVIFAPVYWFRCIRNMARTTAPTGTLGHGDEDGPFQSA